MNRSGSLVALLAAALVLSSGTGAVGGEGMGSLQSGDVETDAVVLQAAVDEDGDATWTIDYRIRLDDENTTAAFESLQEDIRNNTSDYRGEFADRMRSTVATAENATGREMTVSNVSVTTRTSIDGQYGVVSYSFDWGGFAAAEGDRLLLGDALAGLFLDADTKLTFTWPEGYELQRVDPPPDSKSDSSVTWQGPVDFGTNQPRTTIAEPGLLPSWAPYAAAALAVTVALAGGVWYSRRDSAEPAYAPDETPAAGGSSADGTEQPTGDAASAAGSGASGAAAASEAKAESTGMSAGDNPTSMSETPEELLSPEERVLGLLEDHGGRMKQKVVTEELDWSAARTSQVVGDLREAGKVESFRLGRENVLKFPDDGDQRGSL